MLSRTTEYALRGMARLAIDPKSPQTVRQVAADAKVPPGYMAKVMQMLAEAGLLTSQRGLGGGFTLARPPAEISVLDIVSVVEPLPRIRTCPLGLKEHSRGLCALHRRLDDAVALVERAFAASTLADLLEDPGVGPLCSEPARGGRAPAGGNLARRARAPR